MGEKEKQQLMMLGGLILVLVIAVVWSVGTSRKKLGRGRPAASKQAASASEHTMSLPLPPVPTVAEVDETPRDEPVFGVDPFYPHFSFGIEEEEVKSEMPRLNGISWDAAKPFAVIDETVVEIGDMVGEYMIIDIEKNAVTISDGTEKTKLRL